MLVCLLLLAGGLALLASAQASERRRQGKTGLSAPQRLRRQLSGAALLVAALAAALWALGLGFGLLYWVMAMGLVGVLLATAQGLAAERAGLHTKPARRRRRAG